MQASSPKRRIWCHGPKPEYYLDSDVHDKYYVPGRTLALVRPKQDIIILPGGCQPLREFYEFCSSELGLSSRNVRWTSGQSYLLDHDIEAEFLPELQSMTATGEWDVVPYAATYPFTRWFRHLGRNVNYVGDPEAWVDKHANKSVLHNGTLPPSVRVAWGYPAVKETKDLLAAHDYVMKREGVKGTILKAATGTTGEGIMRVRDRSELLDYTFPMGPVIVEECLEIDQDHDGNEIVASMQYFDRHELCAGVTDQLMQGFAHVGNIVPSATSQRFKAEVICMCQLVLDAIKPMGPGGLDFLSVGGKPVLVDPNPRFTACHPPRIFGEMYAGRRPFLSWKISPSEMLSVGDFWKRLEAAKLAFRPRFGKSGVFPLCYMRGMWGMLVAFGNDRDELLRLRSAANELLD